MKPFLALWSGQLLSGVGSGMTAFALGVYAYQRSGRVTAFSLVILSLYAPSVILKPLGGLCADHFNRKTLIAIGDLGALLAATAMVFVLTRATPRFVHLYLLAAASSVCAALREPAYKGSITDLLPRKAFTRAAGLMQLAGAVQHLLAPVMAGLLMISASITTVVVIDAATSGVALIATLLGVESSRTRRATRPTGTPLRQLGEGWHAIMRNHAVLPVVLVMSTITVFVGLLQTLLHPMLLQTAGPGKIGVVQSLAAAGMLISSMFLGTMAVDRSHETILGLGLVVAGTSMGALGLVTGLPAAGIALFVFFVALPFINTSADVLIRSGIPNEQQGRAWGIIGFLSQAGYLGAWASAGVLADRFFEPLFRAGGGLPGPVGRIVGTGPGRGIGAMLALAGIAVAVMAIPIFAIRDDADYRRHFGAAARHNDAALKEEAL